MDQKSPNPVFHYNIRTSNECCNNSKRGFKPYHQWLQLMLVQWKVLTTRCLLCVCAFILRMTSKHHIFSVTRCDASGTYQVNAMTYTTIALSNVINTSSTSWKVKPTEWLNRQDVWYLISVHHRVWLCFAADIATSWSSVISKINMYSSVYKNGSDTVLYRCGLSLLMMFALWGERFIEKSPDGISLEDTL